MTAPDSHPFPQPQRGARLSLRAASSLLLLLVALIVAYLEIFHLLITREAQRPSWLTGVYWTLQTMTTLGYGDVTFSSNIGRLFTLVVLITGILLLYVLLPFTLIQHVYAPWREARNAARTPVRVRERRLSAIVSLAVLAVCTAFIMVALMAFVLDHASHRAIWTDERPFSLRFFFYLAILGYLGSAMSLLRLGINADPQSARPAGRRDRGSAANLLQPHARIARWTFVLLAAALLPLMLWLSQYFGATMDESYRHANGQKVLEFLGGLRPRSSFVGDREALYGGLYDTICAALERWVPIDRYVLRHLVNATFGWIAVLYSGRLAARLFGIWSGVLALVLLAGSPRFLADSMNNPKDLPLASMAMVAVYYFSTISPRWPYLSLTTATKIVVALALALNIRAGALLYLGYLGVLVAWLMAFEGGITWRRLTDTTVSLAFVALGTLLLGTIFSPWVAGAPLIRPFWVLRSLANFARLESSLVVFAGHNYHPSRLPWYYAPWWLLISTPSVVLVGACLSLPGVSRPSVLKRLALWTAAAVPFVMAIVLHSTLYNGIRQLLFTFPLLVVLAASGWTTWVLGRRTRPTRVAAAALLIVGLVNLLWFDIRFHPNETIYFNESVGGPRGAFAKYEMDYWGNCALQAVEWSDEIGRQSGAPVAVSGEFASEVLQPDAARFHWTYVTSENENRHALTIRHLYAPDTFTALADRRDVVHRVTAADGTVLCVVLPGPRFGDLQARLPELSSVPPR